ncbi:unnamed protein product [Absidia cylindrospora]
MIKGFIATLSIAVFMLVCLAANVSAGNSNGSPYGDYQYEKCLRVCYKRYPRCAYGWATRIVGSCYTCCKIKQKWIPYGDEEGVNMEDNHEMEMEQEKPETDAKME